MKLECERCKRELSEFPFQNSKLCIKCTLDTKFQNVGVYSAKRKMNQNEKLDKLIDDLQYVFDTTVEPEVKRLVNDLQQRIEDLKKEN